MIGECRVLLGIQDFQHRRRGISPKVVSHLVDLVEQDKRIDGLGLFHALDDLAGHRTDVGSPVPADFRLVTHAAKADANELAAGCLRHRLSERGLSDARWSDETEDRPLQLLGPLLDGEVFDDSFLDLFQSVVIAVENLLRSAQILFDPGLHAPRNRKHPVQVVAYHSRFGAHRRHGLELLQFALRLVTGFLGKLRAGDLLLDFGDFV